MTEALQLAKVKYIVVFALGSRGDVQHLFVILNSIISSEHGQKSYKIKCLVITHEEHETLFESMVHPGPGIVSTYYLPMRSVSTKISDEDEFYSKEYFERIVSDVLCHMHVSFIITNLFGLEGWILAATFGVPCLIIHPCVPQSKGGGDEAIAIADVQSVLKQQWPHYYRAIASSAAAKDGSASWSDYVDWLWPTLAPQYEPVYRSLESDYSGPNRTIFQHHCASTSSDNSCSEFAIPSPTVIIAASQYLMSDSHDDKRVHRWFGAIQAGSMYDGTSTTATDAADTSTDDSIHPVVRTISSQAQLNEWMNNIGKSDHYERGPICVDFGSMTTVLVAQHSLVTFARAVVHCVSQRHYRFVVVCHGHSAAFVRAFDAALKSKFSEEQPVSVSVSLSLSESELIVLVKGAVSHSTLLPQCVAAVHHGGIGTVTACTRAGIPQVVVPVAYDQHHWAERAHTLQLGPPPLKLECMFPLCDGGIDDVKLCAGAGVDVDAGAGELLECVLAAATTPRQRLRCGTVGRKMRDDPAENGLDNAMRVVADMLHSVARCSPCVDEHQQPVAVTAATGLSPAPPAARSQFPDGLTLCTHMATAPEETRFLYQEVFEENVYYRHGVHVTEGDLVIDVGANIGMFSILSELQFPTPDALRIIAIEPASRNYALLEANLSLYAPQASLYLVAVGVTENGNSCDDDKEVTAQQLHYFPRFPGNSCCVKFSAANRLQRERHMNPAVLHTTSTEGDGMETEECVVTSLSGIVRDYHAMSILGGGVGADRIALLKVDVEGAEVEVLRSIDDEHWDIINQIVLEASSCNRAEIEGVLSNRRFSVFVDDTALDATGCVMLYATRKTEDSLV